MSLITLSDVLVLEQHSKSQNKKDEAGNWHKTGKVFHNLSIWQFGNDRPAAIQIDLLPEQLELTKALLLKRCSLHVDMRLTDFGPKFNLIDVVK